MLTANKEFEVRFLEIDVAATKKKLLALGAQDKGEVLLRETIIYDKDLEWLQSHQVIRIREKGDEVEVTYKRHAKLKTLGSTEIEFQVDSAQRAAEIFEAIGLQVYRKQEKRRHTFKLGKITFDIDTWPKIPAYIEIEGESQAVIKKAALSVGFDWSKAVFENARTLAEKYYKIPMGTLRYFTFDRVE